MSKYNNYFNILLMIFSRCARSFFRVIIIFVDVGIIFSVLKQTSMLNLKTMIEFIIIFRKIQNYIVKFHLAPIYYTAYYRYV